MSILTVSTESHIRLSVYLHAIKMKTSVHFLPVKWVGGGQSLSKKVKGSNLI